MTAHVIKHNHKPTSTPPSTVIVTADNYLLPPSDDNNDNDADAADLMGKYYDRGKKKGKGGHCRRYREDDEIKALHGLYKEPKKNGDDGCEDDDDDGDRKNMEEKEREEDDDNNDDAVDITGVKLFGMHDKEFLGKETENKKKKEE